MLEATVPSTATDFVVPAQFMELGAEFDAEVLAIE